MTTTDSYITEAFSQVCNQAEESEERFVSLYCSVPYYGGPEEGGWWGRDVKLIATQPYPTEAQASAAKARVEELAQQLKADAQREHGDMCLSQLETCGWDGEEAQSRFGEVDGAEDYFVTIESTPGSQESRGSRHYE